MQKRKFWSDLHLSSASPSKANLQYILFQVSVPVHLLQSRNDLAVPEFVTNYVASHLHNCVVEYLPIEGHLPHLAQPELMTEAIRRHIEQPP